MRKLTKVNAALRRNAQVRADILPREDGGYTLRLALDDEAANLLTIELLSPSQEQAQTLAERFRRRPEQIYNNVLEVLLNASGEEETRP